MWGLLLAVPGHLFFCFLAANFQSMKLAFVVLSTIPAVVCGVIFHATGDANTP